jgi:hypothetical protein
MGERPKCLVVVPCDESTRGASPFFVVRAAFFDRGAARKFRRVACLHHPARRSSAPFGQTSDPRGRTFDQDGRLAADRAVGGHDARGVRKSEWAVERCDIGHAHSDFSAS